MDVARGIGLQVFGTALLFTPAGTSSSISTTPAGVPLLGRFASNYTRPDPNGGGLTIVSERPNVTVSLADLPDGCAARARKPGDELELAGDDNAPASALGKRYYVEEVLADSRGGARLVLSELAP